MRYEYYYCRRFTPQLKEFLEEKGIQYRLRGESANPFITVTLFSATANEEESFPELKAMWQRSPIITAKYTNKELHEAEWLTVYPKKQIIDITNGENSFATSCERANGTRAKHQWQVREIEIAKEPPMNIHTAFWATDCGVLKIFTDQRVRDLAIDNNLKGGLFRNVMVRRRGYSSRLYQLDSDQIIPRDYIEMGHGEKSELCRTCGKEQFVLVQPMAYQLHLNTSKLSPENDLYITESIFGDGIANPMYIISKKFYALLRDNKIDSNLILDPIVNVSTINSNR